MKQDAVEQSTVEQDTIAAIATPPGKGGVGVIRISGPHVPMLAYHVLGALPTKRQAELKAFKNSSGEIIDGGLAIYFQKPHSFTGEDVLELHSHGSPIVMDLLLGTLLQHGARMARPGEFSERAFINGKIDLAQAEAVADLIDASTVSAALCASRSLQGLFSQQINELAKKIMQSRMFVEAAIDFSEEEIDFLSDGQVLEQIEQIISQITLLQKDAKQGQILREGITVAIVGQPNAGKSSLLNCLSRQESAIVTPVPGTTRDAIKETIQIDGLLVHLVDTAGIRIQADEIEQEGIKRSHAHQACADRILLVIDSAQMQLSEVETQILESYRDKTTIVMNKIDLTQHVPGERDGRIYLSAKTQSGVEDLRNHLKKVAGLQIGVEGNFLARKRHLVALQATLESCQQAKTLIKNMQSIELVAQELRDAQFALGEIVGKVTSDELLGEIFSQFCVGK